MITSPPTPLLNGEGRKTIKINLSPSPLRRGSRRVRLSKKILIIFITLFSFSISYSQIDTLQPVLTFGSFQNATSISSSRGEFIFVTDGQSNKVYKYSKSGALLASFGGTGFSSDQLNNPVSIDASNGLDVFVCDYQNNRIQRYDINLLFVASFDFTSYNKTADNSKQIYYPKSLAFLSSGEIFVLADATTYKVVKLKSFDEVNNLFGTNTLGFENLTNPNKVVKGSSLDIWILNRETDEILNYDNYGTYVRRLKNPEKDPVINIASYDNNIYLLNEKELLSYDLKAGKYLSYSYYSLPGTEKAVNISILDKDTALLLTKSKVFIYKLK